MRVMWLRKAGAGLAAALAVAACAQEKNAPYGTISMDDVEKLVGKPNVVLIDANPNDVYEKNHLPGAIWWRTAPLAQLLPADKDRTLVFYCASPS
jgi:rhodanese-related sulfurtransferase